MQPLGRLLLLAGISRALYLVAVVVLSRAISNYDSSADLLSEACSPRWVQLHATTGPTTPLVVWDAVFFHRIATCGYEFEQYHAFFPLFPVGRSGPFGFAEAGMLLNAVAFMLSTALFAKLTQATLEDERLTITATLLFILSPATVFHTMPYTEAVFGLASLAGLYFVYCLKAPWLAALSFAASTGVRSNGILNAGFLLHESGKEAIATWSRSQVRSLLLAVHGAACAALAVAPYVSFQYFGYSRYCRSSSYQGPDARPWCSDWLPSLYGFVQDHYWGVGLLKYYRMSQAPNILLAAPTLLVSFWGCCSYAAHSPARFLTGGLLPSAWLGTVGRGARTASQGAGTAGEEGGVVRGRWKGVTGGDALRRGGRAQTPQGRQRWQAGVGDQQQQWQGREPAAANAYGTAVQVSLRGEFCGSVGGSGRGCSCGCCVCAYHSAEITVFVVHWLAMALIGALVMHVQVSTRFLSTCPAWYWFAAHLLLHKRQHWLWPYCFAYMALGAVLFPNYLPWT